MICLTMIVKNEAHVIERCLTSALPIIGTWSIVDTGSTDGTQDKIRAFFDTHHMAGTLHERPWRDFASNRNESISLAKESGAEYALILDADDAVESQDWTASPIFGGLTADSYRLLVRFAELTYYRPHIFRLSKPFRYVGVLHEYLTCDEPFTEETLEGATYRVFPEGARGKAGALQKFMRDAEVLRAALANNAEREQHPRYMFYLAQSLKDAGRYAPKPETFYEKAIRAYEKRAAMGGWVEEIFLSLHEIGRISVWLGKPEMTILSAFLRAHEYRPQRIEPLYELSLWYRTRRDRPKIAGIYARAAYPCVRPNDRLMLDDTIYDWRLAFEFAVTSYYLERKEESRAAHELLLANPNVPDAERDLLKANMRFFDT